MAFDNLHYTVCLDNLEVLAITARKASNQKDLITRTIQKDQIEVLLTIQTVLMAIQMEPIIKVDRMESTIAMVNHMGPAIIVVNQMEPMIMIVVASQTVLKIQKAQLRYQS